MKLLDVVACSVSIAALLPEAAQAAPLLVSGTALTTDTLAQRTLEDTVNIERAVPVDLVETSEIHLKREGATSSVYVKGYTSKTDLKEKRTQADSNAALEQRETATTSSAYCIVM